MNNNDLLALSQGLQEKVLLVSDTVRDGYTEALPAWVAINRLKKTCEDALSLLEEYGALDQARDQKGQEVLGMTIGFSSGRKNYKFDHLSIIVKMEEDLKREKELAKAAADAREKGLEYSQEGVIIDPAIITYTKASISATLPKKA